jgi:2-phospho-L-lactate transferase/gluconeogenesis factor (CofD/UPF0052 family)
MSSGGRDQLKLPNIVLFTGGSGCRNINVALCRTGANITRVVPSWDSGGSSRAIRDALDVLPVGDIRQALMTAAYGEGRAGDVVRICNARISRDTDAGEARREFLFYAEGRHPLLERMEPGLKGAILSYLDLFRARGGKEFDYRNGSIGNLILTGAYFAHQQNINTAIFVFRKICSIEGNVWPASTGNGIDLAATLNNGDIVFGQDAITSPSRPSSKPRAAARMTRRVSAVTAAWQTS